MRLQKVNVPRSMELLYNEIGLYHPYSRYVKKSYLQMLLANYTNFFKKFEGQPHENRTETVNLPLTL